MAKDSNTLGFIVLMYIFVCVDSLGSNDSKAGTFPRRHDTIPWYKSDFSDGMLHHANFM